MPRPESQSYKLTKNGVRSGQLTVPPSVAAVVPDDARFTVELTDEGILYRVSTGEPSPIDAPAWCTS